MSGATTASAGTPVRLDLELVRRGLARSRSQASELLASGLVRLDGMPVRKASLPVVPEDALTLATPVDPWVSRAAYKLLAVLEAFGAAGLTVRGRRCIDVGASTGGFTQVLLRHGADHVVAVDVGHDQLVPELVGDRRVSDRSGVNVRTLRPADVGGAGELVVADLSFISLTLCLPALAALTLPEGDLVVLVKPQFEVGRERLGKGGIVRSAGDRADAVTAVSREAATHGLHVHGLCSSPITGASGNAEFLLWLTRTTSDAIPLAGVAERAHVLAGQAR